MCPVTVEDDNEVFSDDIPNSCKITVRSFEIVTQFDLSGQTHIARLLDLHTQILGLCGLLGVRNLHLFLTSLNVQVDDLFPGNPVQNL